jgi:hypothetical protein
MSWITALKRRLRTGIAAIELMKDEHTSLSSNYRSALSTYAIPEVGSVEFQRWFILEGFFTSDSCRNPNRQPYDGLQVSLTCQQGNHPTGLTSTLDSPATTLLAIVAMEAIILTVVQVAVTLNPKP